MNTSVAEHVSPLLLYCHNPTGESRKDAHASAGHCPAPFNEAARIEMDSTLMSGPENTLERDFQGGVIVTGMIAIRRKTA